MATFKLNGREVEYQPGEMIIEAAARAGVAIPHYCYHPDLSQPANCRMCLVEMVGGRKLLPSCQQSPNERMEILTETEAVKAAQRDVMEYLLVNHPLDCPICDQAGECKLQQYAYLFGPPASSMEETKVELEKRKPIGPHVVLDQERCISCTRCVRFLEEIVGTQELTMVNRGHHSTVDVSPGKQVDNDYSGNIVDMCPVGALTNRNFRFAARVWYLEPTDTTCTLCSRGCNMTVDWMGQRRGLPAIKRARARRNPEVNQSWICDEGRFGHERLAEGARPTRARGGRSDADAGSALDGALDALAGALSDREGASGWLGVLASGSETVEELSALRELARAADPDAAVVVPAVEDGAEDDLLRRNDKSANRLGARLLGFGTDAASLGDREVVLVVDADLRPDGGLPAELVDSLSGRLLALIAHERTWAARAEVVLPLANAYEKSGTVVNFDGVIQRVQLAVPAPGHGRELSVHLAEAAERAGLAAIESRSDRRLEALCANELAPLEASRLERWGARLQLDGSKVTGVEYLPEPAQLFSSAPKSYAEGEYLPFRATSTPPPAVHVAAGAPTAVRLNVPQAGAGVALPELGREEASASQEGEA